ncbi:putative aminopeptidase FrvX [Mycoplasmoides fastidiosum]|uniref:Aminopeptidase FrvX n=1 Tax=Mycoplasmoides fastidiosum TaxID=92758 RepID=A0ABU0LYB5_9BACT|nr:M42 family metallopeptidase [Mycoplasmoides fastidiosum]MDQ0513709.1 putative aminopeptidase FrvX [Mycoplasmoides fastidiosum]UUD37868.1 M42 family metallopeptidase [Mycoplasmoides fastidiosum]
MNDKIKKSYDTIAKYMTIDGLSGYEDEVAAKFQAETKKFQLNYQRDGLGSIIAHYPNAKGPKVMIVGHLDEIGFMVLDILDGGQIKLSTVGGIWPQAIVSSKVELTTTSGKKFLGVIGHTSVHIITPEARNKALQLNDLFADFGFSSKQDALDKGVEIGDLIHFKSETFLMDNNLIAGKAVDNRISLAALEMMLENLKDTSLKNDPYFVGTVQEEVGCRGAKTIATKIKADIAIAVDVCASHDTPGAIPGNTKIGAGVAITLKDFFNQVNPKLAKYVTDLAKKLDIPFMRVVSQGGGTDASELQYSNDGVPTLIVSIPQRYLHAAYGVVSLDDFNHLVHLLTEFIKHFDEKALKAISYQ